MRIRIGSGFGIPVYLHWTFFLLPLLVLWGQPENEANAWLLPMVLVPLVFFCVVLHEFGHALMARRFGIGTRDITLYPIGGVARLEKMTDKPLEEFLIAIAGPAVNVVIAGILSVVVATMLIVDFRGMVSSPSFGAMIVLWLLYSNVVLVAFNLVPAFPMDGGRVLRAGLSALLGFYPGTALAVAIGRGIAVLMGAAGLYWQQYMLVLIAVFVFFVSQQELMAARFRQRQRERAWEFEEPPTVMPVYSRAAVPPPLPSVAQLMLQPKISVYTWDNQTGTWRAEPGT